MLVSVSRPNLKYFQGLRVSLCRIGDSQLIAVSHSFALGRQPFGSCRMRSPIMLRWTAEVPPAIVSISTLRMRRIQSQSGANGDFRSIIA